MQNFFLLLRDYLGEVSRERKNKTSFFSRSVFWRQPQHYSKEARNI